LAENWLQIAALAWKQYQTVGRGFVRFNKDGTIGYVSAAAPVLVASTGQGDRIVRDACARYRPDREIVVGGNFAQDEKALRAGKTQWFGSVVSPRFKDMLKPPDAYAEATAAEIERVGFQVLQARREQERLARMSPEERLYDQQRIEQLQRDYQMIHDLEDASGQPHPRR
jgi:hypothetical protein